APAGDCVASSATKIRGATGGNHWPSTAAPALGGRGGNQGHSMGEAASSIRFAFDRKSHRSRGSGPARLVPGKLPHCRDYRIAHSERVGRVRRGLWRSARWGRGAEWRGTVLRSLRLKLVLNQSGSRV